MMRSETMRYVGMLGVSALLAVSVVVAVAWWVNQSRMQRLENVTTIMLGTSLIRFASPDPKGGPILSGAADGRFLRLAYPRASERLLLDLAETAAEAGVENIVIEINPIVARFANQPGDCPAPRSWLEALHEKWILDRAYLLGRGVFGDGLKQPKYPDTSRLNENISRLYPLQLDGPCHGSAWSGLVAGHPGTRVSFVAMPRRRIARDRIGVDGMADFNASAAAFAAELGSALFVADPGGDWEDKNFADQAHLSVVGAEKFQRSFVAWYGALR